MRTCERPKRRPARQSGFAYVLLLIAVSVIGVATASSISLGSTMARRGAEEQLLAIGAEYEQALRSYGGLPVSAVSASPGRGPRALEELLKDPRAPEVRRHLRKVYADPLTGKAEWGLIRDELGTIVGIYSLAGGAPIKQSGFEARWKDFQNAATYKDWVFGAAVPRTSGISH